MGVTVTGVNIILGVVAVNLHLSLLDVNLNGTSLLGALAIGAVRLIAEHIVVAVGMAVVVENRLLELIDDGQVTQAQVVALDNGNFATGRPLVGDVVNQHAEDVVRIVTDSEVLGAGRQGSRTLCPRQRSVFKGLHRGEARGIIVGGRSKYLIELVTIRRRQCTLPESDGLLIAAQQGRNQPVVCRSIKCSSF